MGAVYAVVDEVSGERLALKRLEAEGASDTRAALFEREYHALASLQHPRIVRVFDYGLDAEGAYYTMELLDGADLSEAAPMPWREVCLCLRDAASILGVLHARRLVHRDLSPRNLWRTPDGRLKLLDFGALASFGPGTEVVGTPPLTAPEVVRGGELTARTDLFALGGLGYWLLTSTHAFPAKRMASLEALWERAPTAPSRLLSLVPGADPSVPPALDELICSLLEVLPDRRPPSTTDVVDALNALADLEPEAPEVIERGYLDSGEFVGRLRERRRFEAALARAHNGRPGALSFEGPEGIGRSRLLSELSLSARLSGATVLGPLAGEASVPYGVAERAARKLLAVLPSAARSAAEPHAEVLARSPGLARALGMEPSAAATLDGPKARMERIGALRDWFLSVATEHTLVLLVDDLHLADEESQSLLALMAHAASDERLLVVASSPREHEPRGLTAHANFRAAARCLRMTPLSEAETQGWVRSLFGETRYLERTGARLYGLSEGRPSHLVMLVRHLVDTGAARYREGAWVLPMDLPDDMPPSLQAGALGLLERVSPRAHGVAQVLSVPSFGPVTRAMCRALPGVRAEEVDGALGELLAQGLVQEGDQGLRLAHEAVRARLLGELDADRLREIHRSLATSIEAEGEPRGILAEARIGLHWLRAGERKRALSWLLGSVRRTLTGEVEELREAARVWDVAAKELRALGAAPHERAPVLVGASVAGYLVDGTYAFRYGDETRSVLEGLLHLPLARRLRPLVGARVGLIAALIVAGLGMRIRRMPLTMPEVVRWFVSIMGSITGVYASYVDSAAVRRFGVAMEPFAALGEDHVAGLVARFVRGLAGAVEDRPGDSLRRLNAVIERLKSPRPIKQLTETVRGFFLAGSQYANAIRLNIAVREGGMALADEIETVGPVQALQANFIRVIHHADLGRMKEAAEARERMEMQAIQLGSGWQAESIAALHDVRTALWTWDPVAMKRAAQELSLLAKRSASMAFFERDARAAYALMRGRFERTRDLILEHHVEPLSVVGWARQRGLLAAAYNGLGEHEQARQVCEECLGYVADEDLEFVQLFVTVRVEHAHALAGLGQGAEAIAALDGLLEEYADRGPLVVGYLRHAQVRIAMGQGDLEAASRHVEALAALWLPLEIPSLRAVLAGAHKDLLQRKTPETGAPVTELFQDDSHLMTRVQLLMTHAGEHAGARTSAGLRLAIKLADASGGFVVSGGTASLVAHEGGDSTDSEVLLWAREQLAASEEDEDTVTGEDAELDADVGMLTLGAHRHTLSLLWHPGVTSPVGALVLTFEHGAPTTAPDGLRRVMAATLWEGGEESVLET